MTPLKPYYRRKNKLFFKKDGKKLVVEEKPNGIIAFKGGPIINTALEICWQSFISGAKFAAAEKDKEIAELTDRIGQLEKLIEKASWLVGNPGCNISSSTDLSCDGWQKEWEQYKSSKPTNP